MLKLYESAKTTIGPFTKILYAPNHAVSAALDQDMGNINYFATFFIAATSCVVLGQLESIAMRKILSTTMGLVTGFYFYGLLYFTNVAYVIGAYLLMKCCSRTTGANLIAWWGMIIMVSVSFHHYHLQEGGVKSEGLALDLIFMTNFIKLHMFAVNYDNAGKLDDPEKIKNLTTREKYFAEPLRKRVSFAEWCQYFFFVGSSISGMSHEYRDFNEFINLEAGFAKIPKHRLIGQAGKRFSHMIVCVVLMVFLSMNVSFDTLLTE